jgi:hypothetical protein
MDDNLSELKVNNARRLASLATQGVAITGLREGYWTRMLEHLCGEDLPDVQAKHELWVAAEIDKAESAVTRQRLLGGVQGNGRNGI